MIQRKGWREIWAGSAGGQTGRIPGVAEAVITKLRLTGKESLLDVGAGNGSLLAKLPAKKKAGIDVSEMLVKEARKRGLDVRVGDATKLPFKDNSFDRVLSYSVLFYLSPPEAEKNIKEMVRVCKPSGLVMLGDVLDADRYRGGRLVYRMREAVLGALGATRAYHYSGKWFEKRGFSVTRSVRTPKRFDAVFRKPAKS